MAKDGLIVLRVSTEDKAAIRVAASVVGKSLTTFIVDSALKEAERLERRPPARNIHSGVPSFFRALCVEASNGGSSGYAAPGLHLAGALQSQRPIDIDSDDWEAEILKLRELLFSGNDKAVFEWFARHYPKCAALIPARRRYQFVAGVKAANEKGKLE